MKLKTSAKNNYFDTKKSPGFSTECNSVFFLSINRITVKISESIFHTTLK